MMESDITVTKYEERYVSITDSVYYNVIIQFNIQLNTQFLTIQYHNNI